ncbi:dipeptidase [Halothermothrix orenii]|uniref:Membrane dipeptidase n=1 Tax=Halothermothrix orenii (strain H 168 / OCM 544 / DSM 9562) TaxID=373903 RepID=B8CWQ2_HALOH|nr:dipeptidase [Halothermothrix orenii]ACL69721.1 Membrane dipeptidase [Halothermothrix orenii H 168]
MKIIDLHCDTISKLYKFSGRQGLRSNELHVDLEKLRQAGSKAQFFALFLDKNNLPAGTDSYQIFLEMLDVFKKELAKNSDMVSLARNYSELQKNESEGKISAFLTIEEGAVLQGKLSNLKKIYRLGVRLITLTWNYPNEIGFPNMKNYKDKGLTPFGNEVIREMNHLGMIIDVSHLSDKGFYDVINLSRKPVIASHSNARSLHNHPRNLTDDMIKLIGEQGGVIGINFNSYFLGDTKISTIADIIKHIKHVKKVGGSDVIALGSDYDGISCQLELKNIGQIPNLIYTLEKYGFSDDDIDKFTYKNVERVIKDVLN